MDFLLAPIEASIFFVDCLERLLNVINKKILRKAGFALIENAKTVASDSFANVNKKPQMN